MQRKIKQKLPMNQLRAAVSEPTINEEKRTVDLTWTTGSKGLRHTFFGRYYEELSLDPSHVDLSRINDGTHPLLAAHNDSDLDSVIGVIERAWLEGDKGGATVRFARDEKSERVFQKVKDGILRNVSVGYNVSEYTDVSQEGDEIPTYRATSWQPAEISLVPIGFDPKAKVRKEETQTENEVTIITRSEPKQESVMDEQQKREAELKAKEAVEAARKEAAEAERTRVLAIRKAVKEAGLSEDLAEEYIKRGVSADEAKTNVELFKKYSKESEDRKVDTTVRVEVGTDEADKKRDGIVESVLYRMDATLFKPSQGNTFVGKSLLRNMESIITRGPFESDAQYAKRVMSSSDLPYILANSGEKAAQKKYELAPTTWQRWAKSDTLRNFKTADRVRSGDFASLVEKQENGEFKRGSFGEEREQVTLKEYGVIMAFTRRMLINDDLSEIQKVIGQAGAAAAALENQLCYAVLTGNPNMGDGTALFHSDHANLASAGALTDSEIGEAFQLMRDQESVDGRHKLNLSPQFLLCGSSNEVTARKYLAQISPTQASNVNVFSGALELIVDAEISNDDYFFAANPSRIDTVVLYRLEGEERPRVESRTDFESEAVEIKCAHSAVAKALDWRGLVKNAGAS
jgi:hypothetical protein